MILFGAILSQLSIKEVWTIMENRDLKHFMVEFLLQTREFYKKSDCFHRVLGVPLRIAFVLDMKTISVTRITHESIGNSEPPPKTFMILKCLKTHFHYLQV